MLIFVIICVLGTALAEPCGMPPVCLCQLDLGIILCAGMNINQIPTFSDEVKNDALFLDILSTNITEMPSLKEWPTLEWVTFRENSKLDCNFSIENKNVCGHRLSYHTQYCVLWYRCRLFYARTRRIIQTDIRYNIYPLWVYFCFRMRLHNKK